MQPEESGDDRTRGNRSVEKIIFSGLVVVLCALLLGTLLKRGDPASSATSTPAASGPTSASGPSGMDESRFLSRQPPRAVPRIGAYLRSRIRSNGDIVVDQWVRLASPVDAISLELAGVSNSARARATNIRIAGDRQLAKGPEGVASKLADYQFPGPASLVHLKYTLKGAVELSPSVPGRALVRITPLRLSPQPTSGRTRVDVTGGTVRSAACFETPTSAPRPCGAPYEADGGWRVLLRGSHRGDLVEAQVDLR